MARIVLVTVGSLGDLHPFIGVALELKLLGHQPIMAVSHNHVEKCHQVGLEAYGVFPDYEGLAQTIGEAPEVIVRKVMDSPDYLIRQIILRGLSDATQRLDELMDGTSLVIASMFALAAPIICEKRKVPLALLMLQPIAILSATAPSLMPEMPVFVRRSPGRIGRAWNHLIGSIMRREMLRRYGRALNDVRLAHGLKSARAAPIFDVEGEVLLGIATYDPLFAAIPEDAPSKTIATGFPNFDATLGNVDGLPSDLEHFLETGSPPIVFTLGSFAVYAPGNFYADSLRAARELGRRAVLLIGPDGTPPAGLGPDVCFVDYAPHSQLFPKACCIVHHGGIGTTGQALMSGKPQLIVPFMGDQPDNANRIVKLGVGFQLRAKSYSAKLAETQLRAILQDQALLDRSKSVADQMIQDGAARAAVAISNALVSI